MFAAVTTLLACAVGSATKVSIDGENFMINGAITYANASNPDVRGLLLNSRMIQGIFDDYNQSTKYLFAYPDTGVWDPERNTREFLGNMTVWREHGMLAFTVGLQGGNPFGYGRNEPTNVTGQPWVVSAYDFDTGVLDAGFFHRLELILGEADRLGMVVIVQMFYAAQVKFASDEVIYTAINNTLDWIMASGYSNILIEVTNECNGVHNDVIGEAGMPATIKYVREYTRGAYMIGSSLTGGVLPKDELIAAADMVMLHGNGKTAAEIANMTVAVRGSPAFKAGPKPIIFNEDDHYDFDQPQNNMQTAIASHASWGVFVDCDKETAMDYVHGYQCVPSAWNINTPTKQGFFDAVAQYTKN